MKYYMYFFPFPLIATFDEKQNGVINSCKIEILIIHKGFFFSFENFDSSRYTLNVRADELLLFA